MTSIHYDTLSESRIVITYIIRYRKDSDSNSKEEGNAQQNRMFNPYEKLFLTEKGVIISL